MNGDSITSTIAYVSVAGLGVFIIWVFWTLLKRPDLPEPKEEPAQEQESAPENPLVVAEGSQNRQATAAQPTADLPLNGFKYVMLGCSVLGFAYLGFSSNAPSYSSTVNLDLMATRLFALISATSLFLGAVIIASAQMIVIEIRKAKNN